MAMHIKFRSNSVDPPQKQEVQTGDSIMLHWEGDGPALPVVAVLQDGSPYAPFAYQATPSGQAYPLLYTSLDTFKLQISKEVSCKVVPIVVATPRTDPITVLVRQGGKIRFTAESAYILRTYLEDIPNLEDPGNRVTLFQETTNHEITINTRYTDVTIKDDATARNYVIAWPSPGDGSGIVKGTVNVTVRR